MGRKSRLKRGNQNAPRGLEKTLTVVSGFPRTGTSTMMRMLEAGGIQPIVSRESEMRAHPFNPGGIREAHGLFKKFRRKPKGNFYGRSVKIVAVWHRWLPQDNRDVRIIFMLRPEPEIIASLLRMGVVWEYTPQEAINDAVRYFEDAKYPILFVKYEEMVGQPKATAVRVESFLETKLDLDAMAKIPDPPSLLDS